MITAVTLFQALASSSLTQQQPDDLSNGFGIALVGMLTVFTGLVTLTLLLPALKRAVEKGAGRSSSCPEDLEVEESRPLTNAEVAAISTAIHAQICFQDQAENMKLTWEDHDKPFSPWRLAGRAEHISGLEIVQSRSRSR